MDDGFQTNRNHNTYRNLWRSESSKKKNNKEPAISEYWISDQVLTLKFLSPNEAIM